MFYNDNLLSRKGPLGSIWTAAHWERRLTKAQVEATNLENSVHDLMSGKLGPMALRLSGRLLLGVTRIYSRKAKYLLEDCSEALARLQKNLCKGNVDLPAGASRAVPSAITLPTAPVEEALAPEPELDVEALLRELNEEETVNKAITTASRSTQNYFGLEVEGARAMLPAIRESELPSEMRLELERLGGRMDMMSPTAHRQSIEVGRRATIESPLNSLPFSPLRTPSKKTLAELPFEQLPALADEDAGYGLYDEEGGVNPLALSPKNNEVNKNNRSSDIPPLPISGEDGVSSKIPTIRRAPRKMRNKPVPLDDEIEYSSIEMQEMVKNPVPLLLPETVYHYAAALPQIFAWLNLDSVQNRSKETRSRGMKNATVDQATRPQLDYEPVPVNDDNINNDDYLLGAEDYAMDGIVTGNENLLLPPHSPKSPRLMSEVENAVPQLNKLPASIPASPVKSGTRVVVADGSSTILAEETVVTLSSWQQSLHLDKATDLVDLLPMGARKKKVADTFLQLLVLHTRGFIKAEQGTPYGSIMVRAKEHLFSATTEMVHALD